MPRASRPAHQLQAHRMAAVGKQHLGPEAIEDLAGKVKEDRPLARIGRPLGAAGMGRQKRDPHTADLEVNDLG